MAGRGTDGPRRHAWPTPRGRRSGWIDYLGMVPLDADSAEYSKAYTRSYQYACIQSPGKTTTGTLWFSLPKGFMPETLVVDGGAGPKATWLLE